MVEWAGSGFEQGAMTKGEVGIFMESSHKSEDGHSQDLYGGQGLAGHDQQVGKAMRI